MKILIDCDLDRIPMLEFRSSKKGFVMDDSEGFQEDGLLKGTKEHMSERPDTEGFAVWSDTYPINSFEVDPFQKATIQTLCKRMQEAAWNHADALGLGYPQMLQRGLVWVLCRLKVAIRDFPGWGETICVQTWPTGIHRLFALREFQISNPGEAILAEAASAWLILEERSRRPIRTEVLFQEMKVPRGKARFEGFPAKLPSPSPYSEFPPFPVRFSDLDWYQHVNNMKYLEWILDSYAWEYHQRFQVASFEINFLSETHYGDEISLRMRRIEGKGPSFLHSLYRRQDGQEVCIACIVWQDRREAIRRKP